MKFAEQKKLGPPGFDLNAVADALQLAVLGCPLLGPEFSATFPDTSSNKTTDMGTAPKWYRPPAVGAARVTVATFYVDAESGNDHNVGSKAAPFRTVSAAVAASRKTRQTHNRSEPIRQRPHQRPGLQQDKQLPPPDERQRHAGIQIYLTRGQTHWLEQTLKLGPADSSLSFSPTPAVAAAASAATGRLTDRVAGQPSFLAAPVVSGGILIPASVKWTPHDVKAGKNIWAADLSSLGVSDVPGLRLDGERVVRARLEPHL
jgi:hypothetical protein